jgi:hypothetical protein
MKENEVIEVKTTGRDLTRGVLMQRDSLETCALLPSVDTLAIAAPPCGCRQTPPACTEWPIATRFSRNISFNPPTLQCYFYTEKCINPTSPHFGLKKRSLFRTLAFCSSADSSGTSARVRSVRQHLAAAEPFALWPYASLLP